jgi:DNA polymerase-3 subunit alpha
MHNHTGEGSNYRLLDATIRMKDLFEYTKELGHTGVAITDHETVGSHVEAIQTIEGLKAKNPEKWKDYKLILGNEIYLCNRKQIQEDKIYKFPHFILIAKNLRGHKALRELSTRAWINNSFMWVNMRVPTFYEDLVEVMSEYKGDIVASTACLGGSLPQQILIAYHENAEHPNLGMCVKWIEKMKSIFGEGNFFLELQPSIQSEQNIVNLLLIRLSQLTNTPYIITTDSHYLKKEDKAVHDAFLKSQEADREVGDFYASTYVMSEQEIHEYMDESLGYEAVQTGIDNTMLIYNMCAEYTLYRDLNIPYIPSNQEEPSIEALEEFKDKIPLLQYFYQSQYPSDRHLVREITKKIKLKSEELYNQETFDAIQTCLDSIKKSSEKQHTPWSAYLLQTSDLIKLCWESGSLVGPSRGSGLGFILLYILDITQVNPLKEEVQTAHWRFLNPERVSPLDIDVDIEGNLKDVVLKNLQEKYGGCRHVMKVQTKLTAKAKNAIQIACRGLGYTPEEATFLGSFIKAERGLQFTLKQTFYGDEENNLSPDKEFCRLMTENYPDVWEVAQKIEGLVTGVGSHAGGVILCAEDAVDSVALMKTNSGDIITQFDLHASEWCSLIKWDLLAIDALQKIHIGLDLLLEDGRIEQQATLKETYEKYLGVYNIERDNPEIWDMICQHKIMSLFQMEKQTGWQCIELGQPRSLVDMAALNSVMRLMPPDPTAETPLERYSRFKADISLWYKEMDEYGLSKEEQEIVKKHAEKTYGLLPNQEQFMQVVQDPAIGGFNLLWADRLRKSIAKKSPKDYAELQQEFYKNIEEKKLSSKLCHYVWSVLIAMNRGYGFNSAHTLAYSIVGLQEANLAYHYPIIYWNCANLISDSGGEDGNTNYGKVATAIGNMRKAGIKVALPDINRTRFGFHPDVTNNEIVYGLKGIQGIGSAIANAIISKQTYTSMWDFYEKMQEYKGEAEENKFGDTAMIALIKAGCFDQLENRPRVDIMRDFIKSISNPIKKLQMSNIEDLNTLGLLTPEQKNRELRFYRFKNYVLQKKNLVKQDGKSASTGYYKLDHKFAEPYFYQYFETEMVENKDYEYTQDGYISVKRGSLERVFDKLMTDFKNEVLTNEKFLDIINENRFKAVWEDKAQGSVSKWEMDSLSYYYHEHELAHIDRERYRIVDFNQLGPEPEIADTYFYKGQSKPRYNLVRICGTVIDKDKNHNTATLLTPDGVVVVRFYKGQFGFYDREISSVDENGIKTKLEKSWFKRGTKLLVTGYRSGEQFIPRKYNDSIYRHTVQLIKGISDDGILTLQSDRIDVNKEEEKAIGV